MSCVPCFLPEAFAQLSCLQERLELSKVFAESTSDDGF